jgi:hypothetical protein
MVSITRGGKSPAAGSSRAEIAMEKQLKHNGQTPTGAKTRPVGVISLAAVLGDSIPLRHSFRLRRILEDSVVEDKDARALPLLTFGRQHEPGRSTRSSADGARAETNQRAFSQDRNGRCAKQTQEQLRPPGVYRLRCPILLSDTPRRFWVLAQLGFSGKRRASTFHEHIKSLRKLGTPFERGRHEGGRRGRTLTYTYFQLMELVLTLTLRVYHVVPDSVLLEIIRNRARLYRHYRQAYLKRHTGVGAPIVVKATGHPELHLRGAYLDLQINFSGGRLSNFGPPRLLSPIEALAVFARGDVAARALLQINLSYLAEHVVAKSLHVPRLGRERPLKRH